MANGTIWQPRTDADGWQLIPEVEGFATGATYDMGSGAGSVLDVNGNWGSIAKVAVSVTDPGYDASGNVATVSRSLYGSKVLRKVYPNAAQLDEVINGSSRLEAKIALTDYLFQVTTIVSAAIAAGWCTNGSASLSYTGALTNNSTLAYPRVIMRCITPSFQRVTGTFNVEFICDHYFARNGLPVACVAVTASDTADGGSTSQTTNATYVRRQFVGTGLYIGVYRVTLNASDFGQGKQIKVTAKAYPWVGDSSACLDSSVIEAGVVEDAPSEYLGPVYFLCDKNDSLACYASVDATNGSAGGSCSSTKAGARSSPYQTVAQALTALKTFNNANHSDNSLNNCYILMQPGSNYTGPAGFTGANTKTHCVVAADIENGATEAGVVFGTAANSAFSGHLCMRDVTLSTSGTGLLRGSTSSALWIDSCTLNSSGSAPAYQWGAIYVTDNAVAAWSTGFSPFSTNRGPYVLLAGNECSANIAATSDCNICNRRMQASMTAAGNASGQGASNNVIVMHNDHRYMTDVTWGGGFQTGVSRSGTAQAGSASSITLDAGASASNNAYNGLVITITGGTGAGQSRSITAYVGATKVATPNRNWTTPPDATSTFTIGSPWLVSVGATFSGNVVARYTGVTSPLFQVAADSSNADAGVRQILSRRFTTAGSRTNNLYNDNGTNSPKRILCRFDYNCWYQDNIKTDTFTSDPNGARTGNWSQVHRVGWRGTVTGLNTTFIPDYIGRGCKENGTITFVDDKSTTGTGTGGGDYTATGDVVNRIPAGEADAGWDLYGNPISNTGTGYAGAIQPATPASTSKRFTQPIAALYGGWFGPTKGPAFDL